MMPGIGSGMGMAVALKNKLSYKKVIKLYNSFEKDFSILSFPFNANALCKSIASWILIPNSKIFCSTCAWPIGWYCPPITP